MQFGVLGPVQVSGPAGVIDIGGARQRRLLAALLLHAGEVASTDRVLDIVFDGVPPTGASTTIRSYIARLRKALTDADPTADELIETAQGGYRLRIDTDTIDATRFEASIETARRQLGERDPIGAAATLRQGLAMSARRCIRGVRPRGVGARRGDAVAELKTVAHEELNDSLLACRVSPATWCRRHEAWSPSTRFVNGLRAQHMLALCTVPGVRSRPAQPRRVPGGARRRWSRAVVRAACARREHRGARSGTSPRLTRRSAVEGIPGRALRSAKAHTASCTGRCSPASAVRSRSRRSAPSSPTTPTSSVGFDAEAQLVANLEHPHIVPIYDYWREPGGAYIVMRLLGGQPRRPPRRRAPGRMRRRRSPVSSGVPSQPPTEPGSSTVTSSRPTCSSTTIGVYLADFGVASLVESTTEQSCLEPVVGVRVARGPGRARRRRRRATSSRWRCCRFQLLTGTLPFGTRAIATRHDRSPAIHVQRPSVPAAVDEVLWRAMAWKPAERFATRRGVRRPLRGRARGARRARAAGPSRGRQSVQGPRGVHRSRPGQLPRSAP